MMIRVAHAAALFSVAGLLAGCEARPAGFSRPMAPAGKVRALLDDSSELIGGDELRELETVFAWQTSSSRDVLPWTRNNPSETFTFAENWLVLRSVPGSVGLTRPTKIAAETVDVVDVQIEPEDGRLVQLAWTRDGEPFDPSRRLEVRADARPGSTYSFGVGAHPLWSGNVDRLAINVLGDAGEEARLHSVVGRAARPSSPLSEQAVEHGSRVQLGTDARLAIATPRGGEFERHVRIPPGGRLRFAFAVAPRLLHPVRFVVSVAREGEQTRDVAEELLDPLVHGAFARWREAEVDLRDYASETVRVILRAEDEPPAGAANGIPLWAHPTLVTAAQVESRPNVVFISMDTLRADHMSLYGYERTTTPTIDAWARERGVTFDNAIAASPWTLPSHTSMFTGLDAISHGVNYWKDRIPERLVLIAERFRDAGYFTHAVTDGGFVAPHYGVAQGFDIYRIRQHQAADRRHSEESLQRNIADTITWLRERPTTPFFLFFHTYETHDPFWARQPWFEEFGGDPSDVPHGFRMASDFSNEGSLHDLDVLEALYDSGVAFADEQIAGLLNELETLGLSDDTIVLLTSDHGEALGEHGLLEHGSLYEHTLRVPMVFALGEAGRAGHRVDAQVRSVDIAPTLLELAEISWDDALDGTSLLPWLNGQRGPTSSEAWGYVPALDRGISLRSDNRFKYIYSNAITEDGPGAEELYDLREDPAELVNLAHSSTRVDAWRAKAQQRLAQSARGPRLHLTNGSDQAYRGSIKGTVVRAPGVVSADLRGPWVERTGPKTLRFTVPPGESFTLVAEDARPGDLHIRGELPLDSGPVEFELTIDAFEPDSRHALSFDGSSWHRVDAASPAGQTAIVVSWAVEGDVPTFEPDAALLDQLRALGYVR